MNKLLRYTLLMLLLFTTFNLSSQEDKLILNNQEYLSMRGLNVMLAHDYYPEGHQGGVGIIQNGIRVATNGDIRLEPTPGQWQPIPKPGKRMVDRAKQEISVRMEYPDADRDRKGFNPIEYPDLKFAYTIHVQPEGQAFRLWVDLENPLPDEWIGKVGFNLELFPGNLFGKSFMTDERTGSFPRPFDGPLTRDNQGNPEVMPMAEGKMLWVAPESELVAMKIENLGQGKLQLYDGRAYHNNGWYVVRTLVPKGASAHAVEWLISPKVEKNYLYTPVIQISQVGYYPSQPKIAVIETDPNDQTRNPVILYRITKDGKTEKVLEKKPEEWGDFLRYHYLRFDFSSIKDPGLYNIAYGSSRTGTFRIDPKLFENGVWQPTLFYFLPVQMCHMRVEDRYKVWHGLCHADDARMAPVSYNHFDGYIQGPSTLCKYQPGEHVPGLDRGGWHDAGDFDLRIESQAGTVLGLALAYESFGVKEDNTTINQQQRITQINVPDGKPDILQQIEHGCLSIAGGYQSMGRLYRGIICPTLKQYVMLGDPANNTDNIANHPTPPDDDWVFTEVNPGHELETAASLAAASRVLKGFNDTLSVQCLNIAQNLWQQTKERYPMQRLRAAVELFKTTGDNTYRMWILDQKSQWVKQVSRCAWIIGPELKQINDPSFTNELTTAVKQYRSRIDSLQKINPYGVPYTPNIWGAGWNIQAFGMEQYFLHEAFPDIFPTDWMLQAVNFILGCHPGANTESFVSGVGSKSALVAYGFNRDDWAYIPGGSISGTALIRPDYPELLEWPYLWQQTEYVLGGGTTDYLFLALAVRNLME